MPLFHSRFDRGGDRQHESGRIGLLHTRLQRVEVLRLGGQSATDLVHRRADDASGNPVAGERNTDQLKKLAFRFIRSSSASLPPAVFEELVETNVGDRSLWHDGSNSQMASNPLPPGGQKPGFVGVAAGPEIMILDQAGADLGQETEGEVCIKGGNVTAGYANNPKANAESFTNGWFRTGDQGYLDADGYLKITGRIKEIINRGGEKVAPQGR